MRLGVCGLSVMLAGAMLGQIAHPSQQRTGQNQPEASRVAPRETITVLAGTPREAAQCTREVLQDGRWTVVRTNSRELRAFRYLPTDELERMARGPRPNEMQWSRARADLYMDFTSAEHNAARVKIRLRFLAEAEPSAPVLRPTNLFSLASTGALEDELAAALKAHCGAQARRSR